MNPTDTTQSTKPEPQTRKKVRNRHDAVEADHKIILALHELDPTDTFMVNKQRHTPYSLAMYLQRRREAIDAVGFAKEAWQAAIERLKEVDAETKIALRDLKGGILARYRHDPVMRERFDIPPETKVVWTDERKAAVAAKRRATRRRNGTMGKRQRAVLAHARALAQAATRPEGK